MRTKRIDEIELYIREKKSVSLDTLCEVFNVSKNTVRRDIATLEQSGKIKKVYGGVTIADTPASKTLLPFSKRHQSFMKEKRLISQLAASHVCDHDTIFIDSGTTCHNIIDFIAEKECTILTNSLQVSLKAIPYENLNVISLPGFLKRETLSFVDGNIAEYLKAYNITKAFKSVIENSTIRFALADHSKFGDFSLMTFCPFKDIDHILTDQLPSEEFCDFAKMHSINIETP